MREVDTSWRVRNPAARHLAELGILNQGAVQLYNDRCRDADVRVLRCADSGVIFLESAEQTAGDYYSDPDTSAPTRLGISHEPPRPTGDETRRLAMLRDLAKGKRWVDIGAGEGHLLRMAQQTGLTSLAVGVEPNQRKRTSILAQGITCVNDVSDLQALPNEAFDVATLFHVLEHLHSPKELLLNLLPSLAEDALLIIEVPHARDILLETYECEKFKEFTLWSEHLVLHTRESLNAVLKDVGLRVESLFGVQRYPITNHLYWLAKGGPGGHGHWGALTSADLEGEYDAILKSIDQIDTLVAFARHIDVTERAPS